MSDANQRIDYSTIDDSDLLLDDLDDPSLIFNSNNTTKTESNKSVEKVNKQHNDESLFKIPHIPSSCMNIQQKHKNEIPKLENTLDSLFGNDDQEEEDEDEEDFLIRTQTFACSTQLGSCTSQAQFKPPEIDQLSQHVSQTIRYNQPLSNLNNRSVLISTQSPNELLFKTPSDINNNKNKYEQQNHLDEQLKQQHNKQNLSNISLIKIVNQFKQQMEKLLKRTKEDLEKEKQEEIVGLKNELKSSLNLGRAANLLPALFPSAALKFPRSIVPIGVLAALPPAISPSLSPRDEESLSRVDMGGTEPFSLRSDLLREAPSFRSLLTSSNGFLILSIKLRNAGKPGGRLESLDTFS